MAAIAHNKETAQLDSEAALLGRVSPRSSTRNFVRHFVEMIVAMIVGMAVLGVLVSLIFALLGHEDLRHYAALRALLMATYMTVGMTIWMRYRGHDWPRVGEMGVAMFAPFATLLVPFWAGVIGDASLLAGGHVLMLPAMLGVMFYRREEYTQHHHRRRLGKRLSA